MYPVRLSFISDSPLRNQLVTLQILGRTFGYQGDIPPSTRIPLRESLPGMAGFTGASQIMLTEANFPLEVIGDIDVTLPQIFTIPSVFDPTVRDYPGPLDGIRLSYENGMLNLRTKYDYMYYWRPVLT